MDVAFNNFNSPLESKDDFVKVMFKITYDQNDGDDDMRSTFINLTDLLSFTPEQKQIMFVLPKFQFKKTNGYALYSKDKVTKGE